VGGCGSREEMKQADVFSKVCYPPACNNIITKTIKIPLRLTNNNNNNNNNNNMCMSDYRRGLEW
jgi:hypothetical protein